MPKYDQAPIMTFQETRYLENIYNWYLFLNKESAPYPARIILLVRFHDQLNEIMFSRRDHNWQRKIDVIIVKPIEAFTTAIFNIYRGPATIANLFVENYNSFPIAEI